MDDEDFNGLMAGLGEAVETEKAAKAMYVKQVRKQTKLSQAAFAKRYHLSIRTLQNWEVGRPIDRVGQVLLKLIEKDPMAVDRMLNG